MELFRICKGKSGHLERGDIAQWILLQFFLFSLDEVCHFRFGDLIAQFLVNEGQGCNKMSIFKHIAQRFFACELLHISIYFKTKVQYSFLLFYFMQTPLKKTFDNPQYLARSRKYDHKCACDICDCGKHKCPEPGYKLDSQTTNNYFYQPYQVQPKQYEKKANPRLQTHYDPDLIKTSYNTSYTPPKIQKQKPAMQKSLYEPSKIHFQGQSQYKKSYLPNKTQPMRISTSPSKEYVANPAKLEDSTTYNRDYSPKKPENTPRAFRKADNYEPSTLPFQGKSNYELSFKPYKIEPSPATSRFHQSNYTPNNQKFQGNTRYREFYKPYRIEKKERCPTEWLPAMPSHCSPEKTHIRFSAEKNIWE